jgi:hypothetical protein
MCRPFQSRILTALALLALLWPVICGPAAADTLSNLGETVGELEKEVEVIVGAAVACERLAGAIPPTLKQPGDEWLRTKTLTRALWEQTFADAERLAGAAETLKERLIPPAHKSAAAVCGRTHTDPSAERSRLDSLRAVISGIRDGLRTQLESAIGELKEPVKKPAAQSLPDSAAEFCRKWPGIKQEASRNLGHQTGGYHDEMVYLHFEDMLQEAERRMARIGPSSDALEVFTASSLASRIDRLRKTYDASIKRGDTCLRKLTEVDELCASDSLKRQGQLDKDLDRLEARRKELLQRLGSLLAEIDSDFARVRDAVERGKKCIDEASAPSAPCDPDDQTCSQGPAGASAGSPAGSGVAGVDGPSGGAGPGGAVCRLYRFALSVSTPAIPASAVSDCGGPCPAVPGWQLPDGTTCMGSTGAPPVVSPGAAPQTCPPGQHWSRDLQRCHAGN